MPTNNKLTPRSDLSPVDADASTSASILVPRSTVLALADAAAALHSRLADILPADHLPAEATDVALARDLAENLAELIST